ncbi:MAG: hypothetical protein C0601_01240, partial [Candidatus Muiribacterium halophilum]
IIISFFVTYYCGEMFSVFLKKIFSFDLSSKQNLGSLYYDISIFILLYIFIKPLNDFLKGKTKDRKKALRVYKRLPYVLFSFSFFLMLSGLFQIDFSSSSEFAFLVASFIFSFSYFFYILILFVESIILLKVAPVLFEGEDLYTKKDHFFLKIQDKLFLSGVFLVISPLILFLFLSSKELNGNPYIFAFFIPLLQVLSFFIIRFRMRSMSALLAVPIIPFFFYYFYSAQLILHAEDTIVRTGLILIIFLFIGYMDILYSSISFPLNELNIKFKKVSEGDLNIKTTILSGDEIGVLKHNFNNMVEGLKERERIKDTFGKYVSLEVARRLIEDKDIKLGGEDVYGSILFSDIRNFTPMSEQMSASSLVELLNNYFSYITPPISHRNGIINKFIGDAVLAVFLPQFGSKDYVDDSIKAALDMKKALQEFNKEYGSDIRFGIGIHAGKVVAGNIGTKDRMEYTVIGDAVNMASRIESENKKQGSVILISEDVFEQCSESLKTKLDIEKVSQVSLKGKKDTYSLYKILN